MLINEKYLPISIIPGMFFPKNLQKFSNYYFVKYHIMYYTFYGDDRNEQKSKNSQKFFHDYSPFA